jgi:putative oligomerization/nucleic acid binding protein
VGASPAGVDPADEIEKLASLRDRGILTDAELAAQKSKVLGSG